MISQILQILWSEQFLKQNTITYAKYVGHDNKILFISKLSCTEKNRPSLKNISLRNRTYILFYLSRPCILNLAHFIFNEKKIFNDIEKQLYKNSFSYIFLLFWITRMICDCLWVFPPRKAHKSWFLRWIFWLNASQTNRWLQGCFSSRFGLNGFHFSFQFIAVITLTWAVQNLGA